MSDNIAGMGLANGFMQGFQFMEGVEDRKQRRGLEARQEQRADDSHGLQMASTEQAMRYQTEQRDHQNNERQRLDDARLTQAVQAGFQNGNPDPELMREFGDRFDIDWANYSDKDFGKSLDVLKQAASGEGDYGLNSPEVVGSFNTVFKKEINKGIGEVVVRDGKKYKITGKRATKLAPTPDKQGFMVGLAVDALGEDGKTTITYEAPVTEGDRTSTDQFVKAISMDQALGQLAGHDMIYRGVQNSPELQSFFGQKLTRLGATNGDKDKRFVVDGQLMDANGRVVGGKSISANKQEDEQNKRFVVDGQLMDANGKVLGGKSVSGSKEWGEPYRDEKLGWVQSGPNGQIKQFNGGKGAGEGGGGITPTVASQIQQSASRFHGTMNPDGSFIMPEGTNQDYMESMMRSEKLLSAGVPLFESIYIANLSTLKTMPTHKAMQLAESEARDGSIKDEDAVIEARAQQIIVDHGKARAVYDQVMSKSGAKDIPAAGLETVQPPQANPATPTPGAGLQTVPPQAPAPTAAQPATSQQIPQERIQQLQGMLQSAPPDQQAQIKKQFIEAFGKLPEGF